MGKFFNKEQVEHSGFSLSSFFYADRIDGVVWIDPEEYELSQIVALKQKGVPVVVTNRTFPNSQIDCVVCNHYKGSYQLVDHLARLGHKDIACVTPAKSLAYAFQRCKGYSDALTQHGLLVKPELTIEIENLGNEEKCEEEVLKKLDVLRKKKNWPTAVFVAGGALVLPTFTYLNKAGIKVPNNISVVAFDEIPLPPGLPKLTCVKQPLEKMGEMAVSVLLENLRGKKNRIAEIILEPTFIPGDSCISYYKYG